MKVHVTRPIPRPGLEVLLENGYDVTWPEEHGLPERERMLRAVEGADAILSILTESIDAEVMDRSPSLKVISNMAVGFDNIDVEEAARRGISVCNTPGVLTDTTADFAWALLMAVARRVVECHRFVERGDFKWWGPQLMIGADVHGRTLGIVGLGKIGRAVARRAGGFGMEVLHSGGRDEEGLAREVSLEELLRCSDFVSLHVPYRESTHHLLGEAELSLMKPSAFLVNTARGAVVEEEKLVAALQSKEIAGAALDVFENEPSVHPALFGMNNVVLAPHAASASLATRTKMAVMAAENLVACLEGREPHSRIH